MVLSLVSAVVIVYVLAILAVCFFKKYNLDSNFFFCHRYIEARNPHVHGTAFDPLLSGLTLHRQHKIALNWNAQLDFGKSIKHFMHCINVVVCFGGVNSYYEVISDIPGLSF